MIKSTPCAFNCTRKKVEPSVIITVALLFGAYLVRCLPKPSSTGSKPKAELLLREGKCGLWQGMGCTDQMFSLRALTEKAQEYRQPIYACFIDPRKAYNSEYHHSLWRILQHSYHLPEKLLSIIRALHKDSTSAFRLYGKTCEKFPVTCGVHQGCVLSRTLYNFCSDVAIHMALGECQLQGKASGWPPAGMMPA